MDLSSYGADGVCPYMAYEAIAKMNSEGLVEAMANQQYKDADLFKAYRKSVAKGILKVMSKMGISTLQSYKGAQVLWGGVEGGGWQVVWDVIITTRYYFFVSRRPVLVACLLARFAWSLPVLIYSDLLTYLLTCQYQVFAYLPVAYDFFGSVCTLVLARRYLV